ncbi:hypothetical protein EB651_21380 [Escherichia coli]|nr:hypothetical protein [Escherichia coli]
MKILSCYVPAFSHIRRGGPGYSPTTRIRLIWIPEVAGPLSGSVLAGAETCRKPLPVLWTSPRI